jgi:hypothetical protein
MIENLEKLDEMLIAAWHSDKPVMLVAADIGLEPKTVEHAWRRLKRYRRLPQHDRPRRRHEPDTGGDGRPKDSGGLLEALHRIHPEHGPK